MTVSLKLRVKSFDETHIDLNPLTSWLSGVCGYIFCRRILGWSQTDNLRFSTPPDHRRNSWGLPMLIRKAALIQCVMILSFDMTLICTDPAIEDPSLACLYWCVYLCEDIEWSLKGAGTERHYIAIED